MMNAGNGYSTFWAPVINLAREPRWGRNIETPGEDPCQGSRIRTPACGTPTVNPRCERPPSAHDFSAPKQPRQQALLCQRGAINTILAS